MPNILKGIDNFYYALLSADTTASVSYGTPVKLVGAITITCNPNSEAYTLFADNGAFETETSDGEKEVEIGIADISQANEAALLGQTVSNGVVADGSADNSPYVAFGFRGERSSSGYSYYWLLKGKFSKPSMDHETRGDSINWQTPTLSGKFVNRIYDGKWRYKTRDDASGYVASVGTNWFNAVYSVTADSTAPTVSSTDPSASATSSSATANISVVFSEPMATSTLTVSNISIVLATAAITISASFTSVSSTVTIDHDNSLTASTSYNVVLTTGLTDTTGNAITGTYTWLFTTSA